MARNQVKASDVERFLTSPHSLYCACGRRRLAVFEPPNKVVIQVRVHGELHSLTLLMTLPSVAELMQLHVHPEV